MTDKNNKPELRFPSFTDSWEECKFEDFFRMSSGYAFKYQDYCSDGVPLINGESIQHGTIDDSNLNFLPANFIKMYAQFVLHEKDIVVGLNRPITNGSLKIARIPSKYDGALLYQRAGKINYKKDIDNDFSFVLLSNEIFKFTLREAVGSDQPFISTSKLDKWEMSIPKTTKEQEKIGSFFLAIDRLITLHQQKLDRMKKYKFGLLQKMFPKPNEKVPEIRFPRFSGNWKQCKLGSVLKIATRRNGASYGIEDVLSVSDEYGCVNQIRFQGRSFAGADISNYKIVKSGDVIYTRSPLQAKPFGIIKVVREETGIVSPLYIVNEAIEGNDTEFIYRVFDLPYKTNNYLSPLVRKGAKNTMNISEEEWLSGEIAVAPSYDEQHAIGQFFKVLDDLILLNQRKLDEMKEYRKGLVQQMFV